MSRKRILMVGDPIPYINYLNAMDVEVTLFQPQDRMKVTNVDQCAQVHVFPLLEQPEQALRLAQALHEMKPFDAVWSFTEIFVVMAMEIAAALGLPHNSVEASRVVRHKPTLRRLLNEHNLSRVEYLVTDDLEAGLAFARRFGYPLILKPSEGYGSINVYKAESEEEFTHYFERMREALEGREEILLEEFLDGPEVSVEFMSVDGVHHPLAVTDKLVSFPRCVEIGHTIPSLLPATEQRKVFDTVRQVLDLIGHRIGPSHTEVKVTSKGPFLIEMHTRPGGDFIPYMIEKAYGIDQFTLTIQHLLGEKVEIPPDRPGGAAVRYFQAEPGIVKEIRGIDELRQHPNTAWVDFYLKVGDEVKAADSSFSRHGCLVITASSTEEAYELAAKLMATVEIRTVPVGEVSTLPCLTR